MRADELVVPTRMVLVVVSREEELAELEASLLRGGGFELRWIVGVDDGVRASRFVYDDVPSARRVSSGSREGLFTHM